MTGWKGLQMTAVKTGKPQSEHNESGLPPIADMERTLREVAVGPFSELCAAKKLFGGVLVQAGALLINHIAPRRRTLTPSA